MTICVQKQPVLKKFSDIKPEKLEWLWKGRIPLGKVTIFAGDPGVGKTILGVDLAAHVSTGKPWPDIPDEKVKVGSVVILTLEDDLNDTVRPRLEAAGANLDKVVTIIAIKESGPNNKEKERGLYDLTKDLDVLLKAMMEMKNLRLVIIDPISAYMGGKNQNSNAEVRQFMAPLAKLAAVSGAAIVGISHLNKDPMKPATYRTLGSIGFIAAARAVWLVVKDPEDEDKRLLLFVKGNLAKKSTGLAFRLMDTQVKTDKGPANTAFCKFEPGEIYKTADEVLQAENNTKSPSRREEAVEWLKDILSSGPRLATEILQQAEANEIAERTLNRAKKELEVTSRLEGSGKDKRWTWSLPD